MTATALAVVMLASTAAPAMATSPGNNGALAFLRPTTFTGFYETGDLYKIRANGTELTQLTSTGDNMEAAWSPDGRFLAFSSRRSGNWDIYVMRGSGQGLRQVTATAANETSPSWSPDGRVIAVLSDVGGRPNVATIDAQAVGGAPTLLTHDTGTSTLPGCSNGRISQPEWNPVEQTISIIPSCWFSGESEQGVLWLISAVDGSPIRSLAVGVSNSSWAPDGSSLLVRNDTYVPGLGMRIARVQADGSGMTDLTSPAWPARDLRALWSPEGTRIAFASTTGQIGSTVDLWVSDVDGSDKRLVVENARPLSWRPYHG